jgi:cytochrome c biogenesis protein CcmG/thiol:disulfide interchange protein DsbE
MPRVFFLLPLVLFIGLAGYFAISLTKDPSILPSALIDKPAPGFDLPALLSDLPGLAKKSDLGGEVKLVNFFASWCLPCRAEHPLLMRIAELKLVPIYGVNYKNRKEDAIDWLDELGNPYQRIGQDLTGRAGIEWGVYGLPETYIIDKQGRIRYRHVGPLFPKVLKETIMPLIEELRR